MEQPTLLEDIAWATIRQFVSRNMKAAQYNPNKLGFVAAEAPVRGLLVTEKQSHLLSSKFMAIYQTAEDYRFELAGIVSLS